MFDPLFLIPTFDAQVFLTVPHDLLVCFVRGYQYREDWAEASFAFLDRALQVTSGLGSQKAPWATMGHVRPPEATIHICSNPETNREA